MYEIRLAKSNKDFIDNYKEFLVNHMVEMQLYYLNLSSSELEIELPNIRGGIYKDGNISIIFLNAYPFNFQVTSLDKDLESFDFLVNYIIENEIAINGVQGNLFDCQQFINSYNLIKQAEFVLNIGMDIMKIEQVKETPILGRIENPKPEHYSTIKKVIREFSLEALHNDIPDDILDARAEKAINNQHSFIFLNENNEFASFVNTNPSLPKGTRVSLVYTFKKYRNKGYAKSMIYLISKKLLEECDFLTLFVNKANPISNKVYKDVGYEVVIDNYDFKLRK